MRGEKSGRARKSTEERERERDYERERRKRERERERERREIVRLFLPPLLATEFLSLDREKEISPCEGNFHRERERNHQREAFPHASPRDGISIVRERARGEERPRARGRGYAGGREMHERGRKQ